MLNGFLFDIFSNDISQIHIHLHFTEWRIAKLKPNILLLQSLADLQKKNKNRNSQ